ncbi:MAG: carboxypeptidase regulatory-like domain-containing protein [Bacteroidetes Order II. Incertae sedis bacterium]|nr:carboxypeptidase regulatory-like domain-containing protein [Bacteroidetes Order II. bacterium]
MKVRYYLSIALMWMAILPVFATSGRVGGSIRGTVNLPLDPTGNMPSATVVAYSLPPTVFKTRAEVAADGTYELKELPEGLYYVYAVTASGFQQFYGGGTSESDSKPIEVKDGSITQFVNFDLGGVINPPPPAGSGVIKGRIINAKTRNPVAYAKVVAQDPQSGVGNSAPTDENGDYVITDLPEGTYVVQAWADGYGSSFYVKENDPRGYTPVTLTKDGTVSGIDISMRLPGQIMGVVTDGQGRPLADVEVMAIPSNRVNWNWGGYATQTDENGQYLLEKLDPEDYYVQVVIPELDVSVWYPNAKEMTESRSIPVKEGELVKGIDFKLEVRFTYGSATGKVTTKDGTPVTAGYVLLASTEVSASGRGFYNTKLEADGRFRFDRVLAGTYQLSVQVFTSNGGQLYQLTYPQMVTINENAERSGLDFVVPLMNGRISGVVKDKNGNPIAQAGVIVESLDPVATTRLYTQTDPEGRFVINNLPDGDYLLSASACISFSCAYIWYKQAETPEEATLISIENGKSNPEDIQFDMPIQKGTGVISGVVTDKTGMPLPHANLSLFSRAILDPVGNANGRATFGGFAMADENGAFVIKDIPEGAYNLFTSWYGEGDMMDDAWYDGKKDMAEATVIQLSQGEVLSNLKVQLDPKPIFGAVVGILTTKDGKAIENALVELKPAGSGGDGMDWMFFKMASFQKTTRTDANGRFAFDQVFRGAYEVAAFADGLRVYSGNVNQPEEAVAVEVEGGAKTSIELVALPQRLTGNGVVAGWVLNDSRTPIENSVVTLTHVDTEEVFTALPQKDGSFRLAGVPDGAYVLKGQAPYHMPMYFKDTWDPAQAEMLRIDSNQPTWEGLVLRLNPVYYRWLDMGGNVNKTPTEANASARIKGVVKSDKGQPISGASVYAMDEAGNPVTVATTEKDGAFQITDLSAGAQLRIYASKVGYKGQYQDGTAALTLNQPIQLANGTSQFDFVLTPSDASVDREEETSLPNGLAIQQVYPNPFSNTTTLRFSVSTPEKVQVSVFDLTGRRLQLVSDEFRSAGHHEVQWQPDANLPNGMYFFRIETGRMAQTGKMVLMR